MADSQLTLDSTRGWWNVGAAFFGLALSYAMFTVFAFGTLDKGLAEQKGMTASSPPLPVLLRSLRKLCDMRCAADRDDIPPVMPMCSDCAAVSPGADCTSSPEARDTDVLRPEAGSSTILDIIRQQEHRAMKALVKKEAREGLWLEDVPEPDLGINDVLIKIKRTAICGTDMHIYNWDAWAQKTIPVPMVVGHEFVGEIVEVGSNVNDFRPGQIVSGEGHVVCGRCRNCMAGRRHLCAFTSGIGVDRPGAFAEYLALPMSNVWEHSEDIDLDVAALFDPFGNAVHTALKYDLLGEDVLITGAGPIGAMAGAVCKHAGARHVVITDVIDSRLALAATLGATRTVNVTRENLSDVQKELHMSEGFDVGLEMSGNAQAFNDMLDNMCHGGKIAILGIPGEDTAIDWNKVIFNMLTLKGIYGREMYETWYKMSVMIDSGLDISPVITHRLGYQDFQQGFDVMNSGEASKVILNWEE